MVAAEEAQSELGKGFGDHEGQGSAAKE